MDSEDHTEEGRKFILRYTRKVSRQRGSVSSSLGGGRRQDNPRSQGHSWQKVSDMPCVWKLGNVVGRLCGCQGLTGDTSMQAVGAIEESRLAAETPEAVSECPVM